MFEPTPEAANAQKLGAADVERAQKAAKTKQFADAARTLEAVATRLPASVHDCNLALVYFRASLLVQAKLAWELSALRNGARPKWCTGDVSTQLSEAVRTAKFVPTSLDITPRDALVEVAGVRLRNMQTVWLPAQSTPFTISAPGLDTQTVTVTIAPPSSRVTVALEAPRPVAVQADAGVAEPASTPDTGPAVVESPVDAAVPVPPSDENALIRIGGTPVGYRAAALTVAVLGWAAAGYFGYVTYEAKQRANDRYPTDPAYAKALDDYEGSAVITLGSAVLGAVATGVYIYFATRGDTVNSRSGAIQVGVGAGNGSVGLSVGGGW